MKKNFNIVLFVHCFAFPVNLIKIKNQIKYLSTKYKIVLTVNNKNYLKIKNSFDDPKIKILRVENKGRDIYPFLKIYKNETRAGDIIIKYHHKLSPHLKKFLANEWNNFIFYQIIQGIKYLEQWYSPNKIFVVDFWGINSRFEKNILLQIMKGSQYATTNNFITSREYLIKKFDRVDISKLVLQEPLPSGGLYNHKVERILNNNLVNIRDLGFAPSFIFYIKILLSIFKIKIIRIINK